MKVVIEYKERKQDFLILGAIIKINVTHCFMTPRLQFSFGLLDGAVTSDFQEFLSN